VIIWISKVLRSGVTVFGSFTASRTARDSRKGVGAYRKQCVMSHRHYKLEQKSAFNLVKN